MQVHLPRPEDVPEEDAPSSPNAATRTTADVERLARAADVNPRTATRFFAGMPIRGRSKARLERAFRELGLDRHTSEPPPSAA